MYINPDIPPSYEVSLQAKLNDANQQIGALTERLAAAEQRGYERALDVAMLTIGHNRDPQETITIYEVVMKLGKLKSDDLKQEGKNGNLTDWRCLHARIAELEQHLNGVMSVLSEIVSEAKTQDPFSDAEGQALLWGARKLLGENVE